MDFRYCIVILLCLFASHYFFFFFKQKTAYEMRISDWSSDVCSSDLFTSLAEKGLPSCQVTPVCSLKLSVLLSSLQDQLFARSGTIDSMQIGRASCRERVCQYV